jgi:DMSO/TMAO reductase YedYZ molybdopterin-dependent catalytic subunit
MMQDTDNQTPMEPSQSPPPLRARSTNRRAFFKAIILSPSAGLLASALAAFLMLLLRVVAGIPTPMELFGDFVLKHINTGTFLQLLQKFSPYPKLYPLGLTLLGMIALGTVLGTLYAVIVRVKLPANGYRPGKNEWRTALAFSLVMTILATVLFWNELRQNFFGLPIDLSRLTTIVGLLADFVVYGVVLCFAYRAILPKVIVPGDTNEVVAKRRLLLSRAGVAVLSVGGLAGTAGLVRTFLDGYSSYDGDETFPQHQITPAITTNADHYVVTQNPSDPTPNIDLWRLEVTGLVKNAGTYTFTEVQQLPSTSRPITLQCIASGVGGHLISTAIWQGVTLRSLLEKHGGPAANASYVAFSSVDGYTVSLPLNEVLMADALLAWRMNGVDIPVRHGYPMRVLIPGRYGEENPKWLTRVELTDHFVGGLYSDQGWYNGPLHTISRIDHPADPLPAGKAVEVGGIAFAGNRGIQKVEVSTDDGQSWNVASLQTPLSEDSWVFWAWQWTPTQRGSYTLVCRATDGTGAVQTSHAQGTVPNGGTGYYHKVIQVV